MSRTGIPKLMANFRTCKRHKSGLGSRYYYHFAQYIYSLNLIIVILILCVPILFVQTLQLPSQQQQQQQQEPQDSWETKCLSCIKSVTSAGIDPSKRCEGGYYCGQFQFSYQYWAEAGKLGNSQGVRDFEKCARDKQCSEQTVRAYFKKFKRDCNNDTLIDCLDMAALHKVGPASCSQDWFYKSRYWTAFNKTACAVRRDPSKAAQMDESDQLEQQQQQQHRQVVAMKNQTLTNECLECICEGLSSCSSTSVNNCNHGLVCGPFAISQAYWKDGRRPGASWTACARTKECSSVAIRNYMDKYKRDCNNDGFVTCEDYAAIHRRGPMSCTNRDLLKEQYWTRFLTCRANQKPSNDANMVKVNEDTPLESLSQKGNSALASRGNEPTLSQTVESSTMSTTIETTQQSVSRSTSNGGSSLPTQATTSTSATSKITTPPHQPTTARFRPSDSTVSRREHFVAASHHEPDKSQSSVASLTWPSSSLATSQNPTYELSPIVFEPKPTSGPVRGQQMNPNKPLLHHQPYDRQSQHNNNQQVFSPTQDQLQHDPTIDLPSTRLTATDSSSSSSSASELNNDYPRLQTTQATYHNSPPPPPPQPSEAGPTYQRPPSIIEYSSLPTIIVSKPLGAQSTSRISQPPPPPVSLETHDANSMADQMTTSSMTTLQRAYATSPTSAPTATVPTTATTITSTSSSTGPFNEITTAFSQSGGASSYPPSRNHNQHSATNYPVSSSSSSSSSAPGDSIVIDGMDYSVSDFSEQSASVDRASFDRVVNGIVANPDFSKSYPPIPEIIVQRKQPPAGPAPPRGPPRDQNASQTTRSSNENGPSSSSSSSMSTSGNNKRENSKTLSPNIYNNLEIDSPQQQRQHQQQQQPQSQPDSEQSIGSFLGPNSLNMTNLFDKGLNESSRIASECLDCICDASSNCDTTVQCISKQREKNRCGLYMISWNQYKESDISLTTLTSPSSPSSSPSSAQSDDYDEKLYYECTTDKNCAEKLIHLYIEKYQKDCNLDGKIDCYDIAAIHRVGPDSCNTDKFLTSQYWKDFNHCFATDRLATTIQPQSQVSQGS